jgi:hypothetical protein
MAIATVDDIASGLASKQRINFYKNFNSAKAAGAFQSSWLGSGNPGAGSAPPAYNAGSGYACDSATPGAFPYVNAAAQNYLARLVAATSQICTLILADRLWSCSGMGFAAGTYTVTTPGSLPARITDGGVGCELWVEQFVAAGVATGTLTASYVNTVPTAGRSGVLSAVTSSPVLGQMQMVPLQVGDLGISQLTSVTTSNTWTSGTFGMTILKRIAEIPISLANIGQAFDWAETGIEQCGDDACLFLFLLAQVTNGPNVIGSIDLIDK